MRQLREVAHRSRLIVTSSEVNSGLQFDPVRVTLPQGLADFTDSKSKFRDTKGRVRKSGSCSTGKTRGASGRCCESC